MTRAVMGQPKEQSVLSLLITLWEWDQSKVCLCEGR